MLARHGRSLTLALVVLGLSCGHVEWLPAPFTPVALEIKYSPIEDLTRIRWRVTDDTDTTFELADKQGQYHAVDFVRAPFASGRMSCSNDFKCYQLVVRGKYHPPPGGVMLRAKNPLGVFHGPEAPPVGDAPVPPVLVKFNLGADNQEIAVSIVDWLDAPPELRRTFRVTFWPEPAAKCNPRPEIPDAPESADTSTTRLMPFPTPTDPGGRYCGRAQPVAGDGGARTAVVQPVLARPQAVRFQTRYVPTEEMAPAVWRAIVDLRVVDPVRCTQVRSELVGNFHKGFVTLGQESMVPHQQLSLLDLSPGCKQEPDRTFNPTPIADETKTRLATQFPNEYHRPIFIYINNLDEPLPTSLVLSLTALKKAFDGVHHVPYFVGFVPPKAKASLSWDLYIPYVSIDDPQLFTLISGPTGLARDLPFLSQLHDPKLIRPLLEQSTVLKHQGRPWKVCQATPPIVRYLGMDPIPMSAITSILDPAREPGFTVDLTTQTLVPEHIFQLASALVRMEVCLSFCNHPFFDAADAEHPSWMTTSKCIRNTVP